MPKTRKSVTVKMYFWAIENDNGKLEKKKAWASGSLGLESNDEHGITSDTKVFNSLEELQIKLHELLAENDISLVMQGDKDVIPRLGKGYPLKGGPWST